MATLIRVSSSIRIVVSAEIFDAKNNAAHHHEESIDDDGYNNGNSSVPSTPPHMGRSKVATTTPKMIIFLISRQILKLAILENMKF